MTKPKQVNAVHEDSTYGTSWRKERSEEPTTTITWKKQGTYTLQDYLKIPDEHRVELIDGVLFDMSSP